MAHDWSPTPAKRCDIWQVPSWFHHRAMNVTLGAPWNISFGSLTGRLSYYSGIWQARLASGGSTSPTFLCEPTSSTSERLIWNMGIRSTIHDCTFTTAPHHFTTHHDGLVGSFFGVFNSRLRSGPAHNRRCPMADESAICNVHQLKIRKFCPMARRQSICNPTASSGFGWSPPKPFPGFKHSGKPTSSISFLEWSGYRRKDVHLYPIWPVPVSSYVWPWRIRRYRWPQLEQPVGVRLRYRNPECTHLSRTTATGGIWPSGSVVCPHTPHMRPSRYVPRCNDLPSVSHEGPLPRNARALPGSNLHVHREHTIVTYLSTPLET
ncbi:hypothetical protein QBC34DRAFT_35017 [Podospora aff. communis PSN243]|uniref:Uncharacterized protein n=1 Tax=Podospora aff. communis PSN243 TaxID=3040156 RepID=A0AAV9GWW8_9PEZI|nr:hypothetical protein QBC34DRAFT_35017 [Podospora aff. communis PSN243]